MARKLQLAFRIHGLDQPGINFLERGIPLMKLSGGARLDGGQFGFQIGTTLFECRQPLEIRAVRGADLVGKHMHFTVDAGCQRIGDVWMRNQCPIGACDLPGAKLLIPYLRQCRFATCLGKTSDLSRMFSIQAFLYLSCGRTGGIRHTHKRSMQIVVTEIALNGDLAALKYPFQFTEGEAGADHGAMETASKFP
jgi:hypothetical protein